MPQFKVTVSTKGAGSQKIVIDAINAPQAKEFAAARYPGCNIGGANRVN